MDNKTYLTKVQIAEALINLADRSHAVDLIEVFIGVMSRNGDRVRISIQKPKPKRKNGGE